ncbi:[SSU ribosomal protein S18P]-alanine acetyltransferase [Pseudidiomarina planktonica]|uniref:[Ribosomal protein bS18]-alanine N-acetyltransferase n=1 Tax=Pseudidiomarina planktonica TaxID=1323738 RepID=A0A1Y6F549_9GAMM|nr:ribosomal protein S18-alanine N-acetyltransferase [Pseudidiomarina planktonica]RUO64921.1 ribosomal-protein-alanine N-acetyltransferase [Pseudidiomarina planktonica]SMQ69649.1 [SSU ribosomal protein S18P]-alanine acetyltransferase [Pseudidiomarina planktonica]
MFIQSDPLLADEAFAIECQVHEFPWTRAVFDSCNSQQYWRSVLILNDSIAGYVIAQPVADELTIMNVAVATVNQGQGYAKQLLQHLFARARQAQINTMWLEVRQSNTNAIMLYQSQGFVQVGRRRDYYPAGDTREDALIFRLDL